MRATLLALLLVASVTHAKVATLPDQPGVEINKAEWNDDHVLSGVADLSAIDAVSNALSAEIVSRIAGDDALSNAVSAEASTRAAADTALQGGIDAVSNALSNEISNRISADNALSNAISAVQVNVNTVSNALSNEISNRVSAVGGVQTNINTVSNSVSVEIANRVSAVAAVSSLVSVEAAARIAADSALSSLVSVEAAARIAADNALSNAISAEISARNQLSVQVSNVQSNVNAISTAVSNAVSNIASVANALSNEISNRTSAENRLSNIISGVASGVPSRCYMLANQTTVSTSGLVNMSGLSFSVVNGRGYDFTFYILYTMSATTSGLGVALTTPTVTTLAAIADVPSGADPSTSLLVSGTIRASGGRVNAVSTPATTTQIACIEGFFLAGADGTLQVQAAPAVGGNNAKILAGSNGLLWRVR